MTPNDLNAIRERVKAVRNCEPAEFVGYSKVKVVTAACESLKDIPTLIAEVEALRTELEIGERREAGLRKELLALVGIRAKLEKAKEALRSISAIPGPYHKVMPFLESARSIAAKALAAIEQ